MNPTNTAPAAKPRGYIIAPHRMAGWTVIDLATNRPKIGHWYGRKEDAAAARDALNAALGVI